MQTTKRGKKIKGITSFQSKISFHWVIYHPPRFFFVPCACILQRAHHLSSRLTSRFPICSGLYGVGKAAENPPALVVLSHTPASATRTIAWVGKGIVYDTGGLCIKAKVCSAVVYFMCTSAKQDKNHFILF